MNKKRTSITISLDDVAFIFSNQPDEFSAHTSSCYCAHCRQGYCSTITHYTVSLNSLYDLELHGFCQQCSYKMSRYIETGENPVTAQAAEAIWKTNKTLHELRIRKER